MDDPETPGKSWWSTMPGILTALAGIITALGGLVAVLSQTGLIGGKSEDGVSIASKPVEPAAVTAVNAAVPIPDAAVISRGTSGVAVDSAVARSPAEVLAGLQARDFKGLAVTHKDGSMIALAPGAEVNGAALRLSNGQNVQFERIVSVEIDQPWDGSATLTLTNGQKLATKLDDYNLYGKNDLGAYRELLSNLQRINFLR